MKVQPSSRRRAPPPPRDPAATRRALLDAARAAFVAVGYDGTDTNRIARAAGYSPQTFYRHFADKLEIFVEVYRAWVEEGVGGVIAAGDAEAAARKLVAEHRSMRAFRASLRALTASHADVRLARAHERKKQLLAIAASAAGTADTASVRVGDEVEPYFLLLAIERWADAIADEELAMLGIDDARARAMLERAMADLLGRLGPSRRRPTPRPTSPSTRAKKDARSSARTARGRRG
jgi:AcrR family transcriptional regulator